MSAPDEAPIRRYCERLARQNISRAVIQENAAVVRDFLRAAATHDGLELVHEHRGDVRLAPGSSFGRCRCGIGWIFP
jgi:hypothetical protein